jgi:hypothetical protein
MRSCQLAVKIACGIVLVISALWSGPIALAADKDAPKTVTGILTETGDKWIKVKADGEAEPSKYLYDDSDKKLVTSMKGIFTVSRVQVAYNVNGDLRQLVSIKKAATKATGTVTGEVLAVYNNFWIEVKPKDGMADGYALNFPPDKYKGVAETLKGLKKGDIVKLTYTTDFERHRLQTLQKTGTTDK